MVLTLNTLPNAQSVVAMRRSVFHGVASTWNVCDCDFGIQSGDQLIALRPLLKVPPREGEAVENNQLRITDSMK
jgi:hypothetical protein